MRRASLPPGPRSVIPRAILRFWTLKARFWAQNRVFPTKGNLSRGQFRGFHFFQILRFPLGRENPLDNFLVNLGMSVGSGLQDFVDLFLMDRFLYVPNNFDMQYHNLSVQL